MSWERSTVEPMCGFEYTLPVEVERVDDERFRAVVACPHATWAAGDALGFTACAMRSAAEAIAQRFHGVPHGRPMVLCAIDVERSGAPEQNATWPPVPGFAGLEITCTVTEVRPMRFAAVLHAEIVVEGRAYGHGILHWRALHPRFLDVHRARGATVARPQPAASRQPLSPDLVGCREPGEVLLADFEPPRRRSWRLNRPARHHAADSRPPASAAGVPVDVLAGSLAPEGVAEFTLMPAVGAELLLFEAFRQASQAEARHLVPPGASTAPSLSGLTAAYRQLIDPFEPITVKVRRRRTSRRGTALFEVAALQRGDVTASGLSTWSQVEVRG